MVNAWRQRGTRWGAKQGAGAVARIIVDIKGVPFCELRASHPTHSSFPKVKRPRPRVLVQTGDRERSEKKERNEGNEENEKKKKKISRRAAERSGEEGDCVAWHRVGVESGWKDKKEIDRRGRNRDDATRRDATAVRRNRSSSGASSSCKLQRVLYRPTSTRWSGSWDTERKSSGSKASTQLATSSLMKAATAIQ